MITKQQQLEWLAKEFDVWPGFGGVPIRMSSVATGDVNNGLGIAHHIRMEEWQQERDKMSSKPGVDNSWHERGELPPVGCECEWHLGDRWVRAETLKHRIGPTGDPLALVMNVETFVTQWCGKHSFRPLRTEREKAIDAACKAIGGVGEDGLLIIERLYDAGLLKVAK